MHQRLYPWFSLPIAVKLSSHSIIYGSIITHQHGSNLDQLLAVEGGAHQRVAKKSLAVELNSRVGSQAWLNTSVVWWESWHVPGQEILLLHQKTMVLLHWVNRKPQKILWFLILWYHNYLLLSIQRTKVHYIKSKWFVLFSAVLATASKRSCKLHHKSRRWTQGINE